MDVLNQVDGRFSSSLSRPAAAAARKHAPSRKPVDSRKLPAVSKAACIKAVEILIMELNNSALCLFDKPAAQTDLVNNQIADYYPLANVSWGDSIEFTIPGSSEEYIDVNDTESYVFAKVTKADGSKIDSATDKACLTNFPIASLFQDMSLPLGDTEIESGHMCYLYLGYFSPVVQFMPASQESHMTAQGWYKDEASKFDDASNFGFEKRSISL